MNYMRVRWIIADGFGNDRTAFDTDQEAADVDLPYMEGKGLYGIINFIGKCSNSSEFSLFRKVYLNYTRSGWKPLQNSISKQQRMTNCHLGRGISSRLAREILGIADMLWCIWWQVVYTLKATMFLLFLIILDSKHGKWRELVQGRDERKRWLHSFYVHRNETTRVSFWWVWGEHLPWVNLSVIFLCVVFKNWLVCSRSYPANWSLCCRNAFPFRD